MLFPAFIPISAALAILLVLPFIFQIYDDRELSSDTPMAEKAAQILKELQIGEDIGKTRGLFSGHYDRHQKRLRLSQYAHDGATATAAALTYHALSHALMQEKDREPLNNQLLAAAACFSIISWGGILTGVLTRLPDLLTVSFVFLSLSVLISFFTLPAEIKANGEILAMALRRGYLTLSEKKAVETVMTAIALSNIPAALFTPWKLLSGGKPEEPAAGKKRKRRNRKKPKTTTFLAQRGREGTREQGGERSIERRSE